MPPLPFGDPAPQPADADYLGKLSDLQKLNQAGVTSGWQALGFPSALPVWKKLADDGKLTVRINQSMFTPWVRGATDPSFLQSQIDVINAARAQSLWIVARHHKSRTSRAARGDHAGHQARAS